MPMNPDRPLNDVPVYASTASIATTPVAGYAIAANAGYLERVAASAFGTTTGTIAVAVSINGGSDVTGGNFTIPAGTGARNNPVYELAVVGAGVTSGVFVNEGDVISFTPSGGTGSSIAGAFAAVIRAI